jgi:hypothetical protein
MLNEYGFFVSHQPTIAKLSVSNERGFGWSLLGSLKQILESFFELRERLGRLEVIGLACAMRSMQLRMGLW